MKKHSYDLKSIITLEDLNKTKAYIDFILEKISQNFEGDDNAV